MSSGGGILNKAEIEATPIPKASEIDEPVPKKVKPNQSSAFPEDRNILRIYTDGSSRGNGRVGAVAGVGVFFGEGDPR